MEDTTVELVAQNFIYSKEKKTLLAKIYFKKRNFWFKKKDFLKL
jgi:hypothetical protein